ncbi:MAG: YdeI/OmpD-associated family protein [Bacteroidota bacterium]
METTEPHYEFTQEIRQLEPKRGAYFYFTLSAATVNEFSRQRKTRLICEVDGTVEFRCGLNHLGDGNFFLILATRHLETLDKSLGDTVTFRVHEDPDQLGVDVPEVLTVFLAQDEPAQRIYERLTDGKKRALIYTINRVKNVDLQVKKIIKFLEEEEFRQRKK